MNLKTKRIILGISLNALLFLGCATAGPKPLPGWLIHVPGQSGQPRPPLAHAQERLIGELNQPRLPASYLTPEQIARYSEQLVNDGNPLDATVFLTAASYTYHRQADFALREADRTAAIHLANATPQGVDMFREFVKEEYQTFRDLDFTDAMEMTLALWERKKKVFEQIDHEWKQVSGSFGVSSIERQNAIKNELTKKLETARAPEWDKLKYPRVADALLNRLKADLADAQFDFNAGLHIAAVPFKPYLLTGLHNAPMPFLVPVCRSIGLRFAVYEDAVIEALGSSSPNTRSNAALILGLRGGEKYLETLKSAYQSESVPIVKWSMVYALIVAETDDAYRKSMVQRIASHTREAVTKDQVDHLILLYQWLPPEAAAALDVQWLHQIVADEDNNSFARSFAMSTLGEIGSQTQLPAATRNLLLTLSDDSNPHFAEWAHNAVIRLKSLDKKTAKAFLAQNAAGKDALLERTLVLSDPDDFDFWQTQSNGFASQSEMGKRITIWGVAATGKEKSKDTLRQLFTAHREYRLDIGIAYASLPGITNDELAALAAIDAGVGGTFLLFAAEEREIAVTRLSNLLHSAHPGEKLAGARLAKMFFVKEQKVALQHNADFYDNRYYPTDAVLRNRQLDALLHISVYQAFQKVKNEFNTPTIGGK